MTEPKKRPEPRKRRGGLGRGLGALIPDAPEPVPVPENPLDVIFPERKEHPVDGARRGGSMRDLLGPPQTPSGVSRETKRRGAGKTRTLGEGENVSRETFSPGRTAGRVDPGANQTEPPGSSAAGEENVSRETLPIVEHDGRATGLFPEHPSDVSRETSEADGDLLPVPGTSYAAIPVEWIVPNLKQPRTVFEQADLDELADSVATLGVLQPVVVRPLTPEVLEDPQQKERLIEDAALYPEARYELVMGERRWRAASQAGLQSVPAIVRNTDTDEMLREALVENLHRVQLNPLEEAAAYSQLVEEFGYTQAELAIAVSKSRPQVANTLRLLRLPPSVQMRVAADVLSAGHARALLALQDSKAMDDLAERIVREGLSVRSTEELVKAKAGGETKSPAPRQNVSPELSAIAERIAETLETSVKVSHGKARGRLTVEFADEADLARISAIITGDSI